jgi:hypothetical protein
MEADAQREPRVPGEPTCHRLLGHIADAARLVGVAELTECTRLNQSSRAPASRHTQGHGRRGRRDRDSRPLTCRPSPCRSTREGTQGTSYSGID